MTTVAFRDQNYADSGGAQVPSLNITIPATTQAGDEILVCSTGITLTSTPPALTIGSTGTAPALACPQVTGTESLPAGLGSGLWKIRAAGSSGTSSDAGKVITVSSSPSSFMSAALTTWSGTDPTTPVDVAVGSFGGGGVSSVPGPVDESLANGVYPVYAACGATESSGFGPGIPSGTTSRASGGSTADVGVTICDLGAQVGNAGTPLGGGIFTATATPNTMLAAYTVALRPASAPAFFSPSFVSTDGNGVQTWSGTTPLTGNTFPAGSPTGVGIRILAPTSPDTARPHSFIYVLPVSSGYDDTTFGNGLDTIRLLNAHNTYNMTVIEASFSVQPWYADNPLNPAIQLESFMRQLAAWAATSTFAAGGELHYLIGFSKSGLGGSGLLFRNPSVWAAGAFWDAPFMITDYTGTDPTNGSPVGGSSNLNYGDDASFQAYYRLSLANLTAWKNASNFGTVRRLWIGGFIDFGNDVTAYQSLLTSAGILYDGSWSSLESTHAWHSDWVAAALASIIPPPIDAGSAALSAAPVLTAAATDIRLGSAHLAASPAMAVAGTTGRPGAAHLSASAAMTAAGISATPSAAVLMAAPVMSAGAIVRPDGLWAIYVAARDAAISARESWHMMRQAGGTDGSAGFLFGTFYELDQAADVAYENWRRAQAQDFPGSRG